MTTQQTIVALVLGLLALVVLFRAVGPKGARIDSGQAHHLVQEGALLLDVRTPGEFRDGHIEGASNIPVQQLAERVGEVPRDRVVVVYCRSGARSARAVGILEGSQIQVKDLGPMSAW